MRTVASRRAAVEQSPSCVNLFSVLSTAARPFMALAWTAATADNSSLRCRWATARTMISSTSTTYNQSVREPPNRNRRTPSPSGRQASALGDAPTRRPDFIDEPARAGAGRRTMIASSGSAAAGGHRGIDRRGMFGQRRRRAAIATPIGGSGPSPPRPEADRGWIGGVEALQCPRPLAQSGERAGLLGQLLMRSFMSSVAGESDGLKAGHRRAATVSQGELSTLPPEPETTSRN